MTRNAPSIDSDPSTSTQSGRPSFWKRSAARWGRRSQFLLVCHGKVQTFGRDKVIEIHAVLAEVDRPK